MSYVPRVPIPEGALYAPGGPLPATVGLHLDEDLASVRLRFMASLAGGSVSAELKEMIRVYNASMADCEFCKNVRYARDGKRVLDEDAVGQVRNFEDSDLPARAKAALRFAKAFYLETDDVPGEVGAELRRHYSDEEILEIVLKLLQVWAGSNSTITLGLEVPDMAVMSI